MTHAYVEELDPSGPIALVRDGEREHIVEWLADGARSRWTCTCGKASCLHRTRVGQSLPLHLALRLLPQRKSSAGKANKAKATPDSADDFEETRAEARARGAEIRAERMAKLDAARPAATEAVVRAMTDEDRQRLRSARERKRRLRGPNTADEDLPVGNFKR